MTVRHELIAALGPRVRTSPFFDRTVDAGLSSVSVYNHMWLPMSYGDPDAEYERLTTGVSMWDVSAQRHIEVAGPDADQVVQAMTIVDTSTTEVGRARYAPMVDGHGRLINDPVLLHVDHHTWRFSIADSDVRLWIEAKADALRFESRVQELDTATLAVQGPKANHVMDALGLAWTEELEDFEFRRTELVGVPLLVSRSGWSSQGGFELFLDDPDRGGRLWDAVEAAGAGADIGPGGPNPSERIENVLLSYGTDTGYDADPFELGLGDLVDFDVGSFVGRDALVELQEQGCTRRLCGVILDSDRTDTLQRPAPISCDDELVGELRSAAWSPRFGHNLGLALLAVDVDDGRTVRVIAHESLSSGVVVDLPFEVDD